MLNNDVFGARPKLVRTPIISVSNPLYNVIEVDIHAPPVSPIPLNSVVSDCQENFENIVDTGSTKLIQDPVRKIQGSTDKELRTRVYSEIQKKLRSYSGYQQVDPLLKTPPHRQWIREEETVFKSSDDVSSPLLPYLTDSSTPKSSRRITPIIDWTRRLSNFIKEKTTNGIPFLNSIEQISSGTNRNSDSKNSRRSNTRAECSLSESSSSTSIINPSFEELRGKKDRFSKKQSSSLDAITSVIPEYSGVGHRVGADRSISGDEVSRDNNRIIEIPTRTNPARAEGSKRISPGNQAVDGSTIKLREENIDIPSGGNSVSSRNSSVCTKKRRTFPKLFSKPGNTKGRRGRRLSHGSSRNWRSVLLRAGKFYKFTRQFSEKYSSPLRVSELSLQIGTSTITQSGAIGNTQAGADQSIEQIKSASPSQEVLTQNIYPRVRIIDQENEEEFEEINFISSFSFRGTSPESEQAELSGQSKQVRESISPEPEKTITREQNSSLRRTSPAGGQAEPSGQSKTIRESVSPEPEKTIAREQNSSLRRTSPGEQTLPSEQSQRFGVLRSTQSEKTITKEQTLDGIFADFGESRNSTITNKGTEPIESIDYRDRNQKQHRKIPSTHQTSPKRSARVEDFCLLSNTNLITKMNTDTTPKFAAASDLSAFQKDQYVRSSLPSLPSFSGGALQRFDTWLETFEAIIGIGHKSFECQMKPMGPGWDAIRKHGFTINGENQSIYLAREEPDQQKGTSGPAPEMTITASQRVKILQQSVMVIEAKMKRSIPYVSPKATVVFTYNKTLPGGLVIRDFVSTVSNDGKYSLLVENHSMHSVCLPRSSQLGTIEIASSIIGKVKIDYESSLGDKTQVWLNCEDPEKGNMDNDNKLRDKTQVWLNCEDPDKVEIDNDSSLGDKTHDCLRQYYEDPESFKEP
ncbi:hypothetical protein DAPPUDRAFT_109337 [Daphnia pulex]|uniref:Uncharacterized protein n=1 Tax=Daphnia pulex TaxID=6669 RepID=E9H2Q1_DAPPU|nr:hypothetical protein DAPPUDRAFT_109337 [Daphnia pulex]|eukprot:EFX74022.1 hypothetical protein DAPPUDRAFT_109337 [Daphnia pulex]